MTAGTKLFVLGDFYPQAWHVYIIHGTILRYLAVTPCLFIIFLKATRAWFKNLTGKLIPKSFFPSPKIFYINQYFNPNKHLMLNVEK